MPVELWFPVPVFHQDVDPHVRDVTHAKVKTYLETEGAKRDVSPVPFESLETSYFAAKTSVLEDAKLAELKETVLRAGDAFVKGLGCTPIPLEIERSWINIFRPGTQEAQHSHDGSLLSATYYVEAPEKCGDLVLPDPIGARRSHRAFTSTTGKTFFTMPEVGFPPQAGRLIMFESWVPHGVQCNKSDKIRISLAFNLRRAA